MARFLLDTDTCSYAMQRRSAKLQTKLMMFAPGALAVSAITVFELHYGVCRLPKASKPQAFATIKAFLDNVEVLDFTQQAAECAGMIRAQLAAIGQPIGAFDLLIAGHTQSVNAVLVTNNIREFSRVEGLIIDNWLGA